MIVATFIACALMAVTWVWARRIDNYGIVDPVWALSFTPVVFFFAANENGLPERRLLIATLVAAWSLRLGSYLALRAWRHHPSEDGRYRALRTGYGAHVARGFFGFFQIQALSVVALSVPFYLIARNPAPNLSVLEIVGAVSFVIALLGESLADRQMNAFKAKHPGRVCDVGLWRFSRHPNYFFEACIWISFYVVALASPYGAYTAFAPAFILYLLLRVTGVPPAEAQALRSRGDAYRAYQRRTSMFVPWFPGKEAR